MPQATSNPVAVGTAAVIGTEESHCGAVIPEGCDKAFGLLCPPQPGDSGCRRGRTQHTRVTKGPASWREDGEGDPQRREMYETDGENDTVRLFVNARAQPRAADT